MNRKPKPERIDADNPEWTDADVARAKTFDQLPESLHRILSTRRRGPQKTPTKVRTSLRLSPEVVQHFKDTGPGWQTRIDAALLELIARPATRFSARQPARKAAGRKPVAARTAKKR